MAILSESIGNLYERFRGVLPSRPASREDLIRSVRQAALSCGRERPWPLKMLAGPIQSPMLPQYWESVSERSQAKLDGPAYIQEPWPEGIRVLVFYDPSTGFHFYGRKLDPDNLFPFCLPVQVAPNPKIKLRHLYPSRFCLDGWLCLSREDLKEAASADLVGLNHPHLIWEVLGHPRTTDLQRVFQPFRVLVQDILIHQDEIVTGEPYADRRSLLDGLLRGRLPVLPLFAGGRTPRANDRGVLYRNTGAPYRANEGRTLAFVKKKNGPENVPGPLEKSYYRKSDPPGWRSQPPTWGI